MSDRFLLRRDRVVQAGAGTGKTHALLTQYLHLCAGLSARPEPLLPRALCALTFTDKAAGEMRERLQRRTSNIVRAIGPAAGASEVAAALQALHEDDLIATAAALGRPLPGLALWEQILAQLPGAPIGTFHSFAASLLRRYAALAGLDPDFTLLDEDSARALLLEAGERVVLRALEGRLTETEAAPEAAPEAPPEAAAALTGEAGAAALAEQAALVVGEYGFSGGPSAEGGIVEALCRLHRLRSEEGRGAQGLAGSYLPAVLAEELSRIRTTLGAALESLGQLGTQLGAGSAERVAEICGLRDALLAQLRQPDVAALYAARPLGELVLQGLKKLRAKKDAAGAQDELTQLKERIKIAVEEVGALHASLRAAPLAAALERLLAPVTAAYEQAKQAAGALDFTDLLRRTRDLLRDHPTVRAEAQGRFAVLLVDEFQDTNPLQAELLELLAGPIAQTVPSDAETPSGPPSPREPGRLYIVGDRKQSIYEFRGADVAAYTALCDRLIAGGADQETLSRSYRSRPTVLHFVSTLFAEVMTPAAPAPPAGELPPFFVRWDPQRDPLQAVRPADPAQLHPVELVRSAAPPTRAPADEEADSAQAGPATAAAIEPHPLDREADLLAQRILALRDQGARLGDIVVLLRRFTHLFRYTLALKRAGIAHYVVRGRGFYKAQEVQDVAALLTLLSDPEDRLALLTLLRSPLCGLSDDSLLQLHLGGRLTLPALLRERRDSARRAAPESPDAMVNEPEREAPDRSEDELLTALFDADAELQPEATEATAEAPPLELLDQARVESSGLGLPADEHLRLRRLLDLLAVLLRQGDRLGPSACLQALYDHTDLLAVLAADPDGEQRVANLLRLQERAREFDRTSGLRGFVRALRLATDPQLKTALASPGDEPAAQIAGEADDVVRIMTVHQSKGLEFPIVFVAGCTTRERADSPAVAYDRAVGLGLTIYEDGERVRTLAARQVDALNRLRASAESARLFYVAATRAREQLIFLGESGPRPRLTGTWRAHLDALLEAGPDPAPPGTPPPPLRAWHPGPPPPPPVPSPVVGSAAALLSAARQAARLVYADPAHALAPLAPPPVALRSPLGSASTAPSEPGPSLGEPAAPGRAYSVGQNSLRADSPGLPHALPGSALGPNLQDASLGAAPSQPPPAVAPALQSLMTAPVLTAAAAADLLVCPRRFHLRTTARLFPAGPVARPAWSDEAAGSLPIHEQLVRGNLAAQVVASASADCQATELEAILVGLGLDPAEPRVLELRGHLLRFFSEKRRRGSRLGRLLTAGPGTTVQQAVPYAVTAAGGAVRLHGVLDVLHGQAAPEPGPLGGPPEGPVFTVLDYHYGCAPEPEGPLHLSRRALIALAAARLHPEARQLRTGLCFLHEADPSPALRPVLPADLHAVEQSLAQAVPLTRLTLPAALRLPVLAAASCARLGCEYQPLCHPRPSAPAPALSR